MPKIEPFPTKSPAPPLSYSQNSLISLHPNDPDDQNTAITAHLPSTSPFFLPPTNLCVSRNKATQTTGLSQL